MSIADAIVNAREVEALREAGHWFGLTGKWNTVRVKISVVGQRWETTYERALDAWRNSSYMSKAEFAEKNKNNALPDDAYYYALSACAKKVVDAVAKFQSAESLQEVPAACDLATPEELATLLADREFVSQVAKNHSTLGSAGGRAEDAEEDRKNSVKRSSQGSSIATSTKPKPATSTAEG